MQQSKDTSRPLVWFIQDQLKYEEWLDLFTVDIEIKRFDEFVNALKSTGHPDVIIIDGSMMDRRMFLMLIDKHPKAVIGFQSGVIDIAVGNRDNALKHFKEAMGDEVDTTYHIFPLGVQEICDKLKELGV